MGKGRTFTPSQQKTIANQLSKKGVGKGFDVKTKKSVTSAKSTLTKAQNKFNKANKSYKGKNFKVTKNGKALQKSITNATKNLTTANNKAGQGAFKVLQTYIKKHGTSGLIRTISKKLGYAGALKLVGKLGLGTVLSGTGLGTAAGVALNIHTLYQVYNIIKDLSD